VDELKDQFIGLVSHELRTPLTVIMGAVNTALSETTRLSPQETRQLLEDAASESEGLSHILENLLELSRSQAGRLSLHLEPLMLEDVVQKTIHEARRHSSTHQFVIDLPKKIPPLRADRIRLERILHNLVENAVKHSPGGEVRVSARQEGKNLVIAVHDHGPGISPQDQPRLFQPFWRKRQADTDAIKGVGLGLVVCRRLAEAHGGRIWLESKPGHGTTFFFTLPIEATRRK
jgi:two-component system sensor histidine kinase VicK